MRQLTNHELGLEIKKLSKAQKSEALGYAQKVRNRLKQIKASDPNNTHHSIKYIDETISHAVQGPFTDLMKLDALNRLRRDFVRHNERAPIEHYDECIAKIDAAIGQYQEPDLPDIEDYEEEDDDNLTLADVSTSQDKNRNIFGQALRDADANIDEVYAPADAGSRVVAYLTAFNCAVNEHLSRKFHLSESEIDEMQHEFLKTMLKIKEVAVGEKDTAARLSALETIAKDYSRAVERS